MRPDDWPLLDFSLVLSKIVERKGKFYIYNKDGTKKLAGPYDSKKEALKRLREIEYFKHRG